MSVYNTISRRLVKHNGVLKWQVCECTITYTDSPWYRFWQSITKHVEVSEPWYEEIPEIDDE